MLHWCLKKLCTRAFHSWITQYTPTCCLVIQHWLVSTNNRYVCVREGGVYVYSLHTIIDHIPLHASTHRNTIKHVCKDVHTYVRTQRYKHIYKHTLKQTCMIDTGPSWMYSRADFLFPDILGLSAISILFMGTQLIELYNNTNHYHYITKS